MATIYSLPTELIRHTLSLAYPPIKNGSASGLCSTALVHSSWKEPSVSVMTEVIFFGADDDEGIRLFCESGPSGFASVMVSFEGRESGEVMAVLGRAKAGGVKGVRVCRPVDSFPDKVFSLPSLSGELSLIKANLTRAVLLTGLIMVTARCRVGLAGGGVARAVACSVDGRY
jgi:hypothetical protein